MLNISPHSIRKEFDQHRWPSLKKVNAKNSSRVLMKVLIAMSLLSIVILLLPWTQNIRARGSVTTLRPDQRPQTIHSIIAGRIESWYVKEGDFVRKGDTILFISEVKDEYFDPQLLSRTEQQLKAKEMAVNSYMEKIKSLDNQIDALAQTGKLKRQQADNKLEQALLKVASDSIDYEAAIVNLEIAKTQYKRIQTMMEEDLASKLDLENRKLILQRSEANVVASKNQMLSSKNEVLSARMELNSISAQYRDEISKAESEKYAAMSDMYDAEAVVTKLQNQYMNYSIRTGMYYITAPQDGYVTKAIQSGLGETLKEGDEIVSIMPYNYDLAVEMFIRPLDLPLIQKGQKVRLQFDGWPAIVFSGWPNTSYGTYGGEVFAIDNFISENGLYRLLLAPDTSDHEWPDALRVGSGTNNMILLKDVPIWYELWRRINGFPPDYYVTEPQSMDKK